MILDLTLDALQIPGLPTFTPVFGTKKADGDGLTTAEVNNNVLMPWSRQRPFTIAENSSTGNVEADTRIVLSTGCLSFTLGNGTFNGVRVEFYNSTNTYIQLVTSIDTGWIVPYQKMQLVWFADSWYVDDGHQVGEIINIGHDIEKMPYGYLSLLSGLRPARSAYYRLASRLLGDNDPVEFTCTTASPSIFTSASHRFVGGERLRLYTTGELTGATLSQDYFVEFIDSNTFYLNTSDTSATRLGITQQSGTHTYIFSLWGVGDGSTTFDLPDPRQAAFVGSGLSTSHDVSDADAFIAGQFKDDQLQNLTGTANVWSFPGSALRSGVFTFSGSTNPTFSAGIGYAGNLLNFNASNSPNARTGLVTRGKSIGTNFIIKY